MKAVIFFVSVLVCTLSFAQTPIDELQKNNLKFLEDQELKGYEFRSQIITEFDLSHAQQEVNIKLSKDYTYVISAIGDSNIPAINLEVKPIKNSTSSLISIDHDVASKVLEVSPIKSGRFNISINALELSEGDTGFISFMVLRK